jgi:hypothetical protein
MSSKGFRQYAQMMLIVSSQVPPAKAAILFQRWDVIVSNVYEGESARIGNPLQAAPPITVG